MQRIITGVSLVKLVSWYGGQVMTTWDDEQAEMLNRTYEGRWYVWFVRTVYTGTTWHARPAGTEVATVNADSPEALVAAIAEQEAKL